MKIKSSRSFVLCFSKDFSVLLCNWFNAFEVLSYCIAIHLFVCFFAAVQYIEIKKKKCNVAAVKETSL